MKSGFPSVKPRKPGFIFVTVLILSTFLLSAATALALFVRQEVKRVETERFSLEARSVAEMAYRLLARRIAADTNKFDSPIEPLYSPNIPLVLTLDNNLQVSARITPLSDKIPINGLFLPDNVTLRNEYTHAWERIWEYLKRPELAPIVLDFIDSDTTPRLGGIEREENPNRKLADLSELLRIPRLDRGVLWGTAKIPGGLARFCTLYGDQMINVNVAGVDVLAVLDSEMTLERAKAVVQARAFMPIRDADDLRKIPGFPSSIITRLSNVLGFKSDYFLIAISVTQGDWNRRFHIYVKRKGESCEMVKWEE